MPKRSVPIEKIAAWVKRPFLDKMLDDGHTIVKVVEWCLTQGLSVTNTVMTRYNRLRMEATIKGTTLEALLAEENKARRDAKLAPKREKLKKQREDQRLKEYEKKREARKQENLTVDKISTDLELLDAVMQKGFETLNRMDAIAPKDFLKALEIKHKITGGAHSGLTTYGVEEIRLRENARENAMLTILLEFIPEDKHEEVLERMESATQEFYESIGLGDEYEQANG